MVVGLPFGLVGGLIGLGWAAALGAARRALFAPPPALPRFVLRGGVAGLVVGLIGVALPETLFWSELEARDTAEI